ncbi:hypothetical protein BDV12DRAFT_4689 [Aspergillus spectabilis]
MYLKAFPPSAQELSCPAAVSSRGTRLERTQGPCMGVRLELHDWWIRQDKGSSSLILGRCPPLKFASGFGFDCAGGFLRHPRSKCCSRSPVSKKIEHDGGSVMIVSVTGCPSGLRLLDELGFICPAASLDVSSSPRWTDKVDFGGNLKTKSKADCRPHSFRMNWQVEGERKWKCKVPLGRTYGVHK